MNDMGHRDIFDINVPILSQIFFEEFIRLLQEIRSSHYLQLTYVAQRKPSLASSHGMNYKNEGEGEDHLVGR